MLVIVYNDTATTEIYPLSLLDALPISRGGGDEHDRARVAGAVGVRDAVRGEHVLARAERDGLRVARPQRQRAREHVEALDRKSTRLNSSHANISYAVFCLKKYNMS